MKLREIGIQPEILLCRSDRPIEPALKKKIALFTNVAPDAVFSAEDVSCIYEVPIHFHNEGVDDKIAELLNIWTRAPELTGWERVVHRIKSPQAEVDIGLVGKYVDLVESYKSLNEALTAKGMVVSGVSPDRRLVEMVELPNHPYFVGCQFHPEFKSRPQEPHPLFQAFIGAALRARLASRRPASREVELGAERHA